MARPVEIGPVEAELVPVGVVDPDLSPLRTDSLPFVSKMYWPENADDAIMDVP